MRIEEILDNVLDELSRAEDLLAMSMDEGGPEEELVDDIRRDRPRLNKVYDALISLGVNSAELDVE